LLHERLGKHGLCGVKLALTPRNFDENKQNTTSFVQIAAHLMNSFTSTGDLVSSSSFVFPLPLRLAIKTMTLRAVSRIARRSMSVENTKLFL
jgi:hypothetical protein